MPFDPTLPANNSPIVSAELRNQLNALNDTINDCVAGLPDTIAQNAAASVDNLNPLSLTISNPPTQAQVQAIANALADLINALRH